MKRLLILLSILPNLLFGQHQELDSLDAFITKQVMEYKIPGLAIGIIKDNKVIFKKGYGVNSTIDSIPVTGQTTFPILSCTKAFTAAGIGLLVDEGKLHWNDKVIKYLPDFTLSDPWITKELTISDLLSHRSGLGTFDGDLLWYGTKYSREEIIHRIRYYPIKTNFRIDFAYQNVMYLVAGLIIEAVTGKTWDDFIKEKIFTPLSMNTSSTSISQLPAGNTYAHPHLRNKAIPLVNIDNIGPAGSINSNIEEMLHWLQMWIDKGNWKGKRILSEKTIQTITSPKTIISNTSDESYGFGWYIGSDGGKKSISHNGGLPGYKSSIVILPESAIGIILLTNKISYLNEELMGIIINFLINPEKTNWKEADKNLYFKNFRFSWDEERENAGNLPSNIPNEFGNYKGVYEDKIYGKAIIKEKDGKAFLELLPSKKLLSGYLYYLNEDTLKIIFQDESLSAGKIIFDFDTNKQAQGFTIDLSSDDFHFESLDFKKIHNRR